ncbi:MAG: thioredoxin domain-containing protein, partial [Vicinamibacterales bacterium]
FYGGTYFPPTSQWGRPAFRDVLGEIARAWGHERMNVQRSAVAIVDRLAVLTRGRSDRRKADGSTLTAIVRQFQDSFDSRRGGFGDAPKFPRPSELLFLLREHVRTGDDMALRMVTDTLRAMALGGMRDHIGGGFHRYSVDGAWRVPHFEKMLYDQAQLVLAYLEAAQATGDPFFALVAEDTLQYVRREMSDPGGGFYSAEDADSVPPEAASAPHAHKSEGAFYIWSVDEVRAALGADSAIFEGRYGLLPNGNAPFDPQNEFGQKNLLHTAQSIADLSRMSGLEPLTVAQTLMRARDTLFDIRQKRPRPHLDDKVLTAWNGLVIAAFARAARVLSGGTMLSSDVSEADPGAQHLQTATRAAEFLRNTMWDADRRVLLRRYRAGHTAIEGYAEDYACLIFGLLELFQASGEVEWLAWARQLQDQQDELFWDDVDGGWFSTTGNDPSVLLRAKEDHDGAEPSPTSVAALNLLTLAHLTGESRYSSRATAAIESFAGRLIEQGRAVPMMAAALSASLAGGEEILILGTRGASDTDALWRAVHRRYRPFGVSVVIDPRDQERLSAHMPWVASMSQIDGQATAFVCRDFVCSQPATSGEALQ